MKHIDEKDFEIREVQIAQKRPGLFKLVKNGGAAIRTMFQTHDDLTRLTTRLRQDARIEELEIERKKLMSAPLIR